MRKVALAFILLATSLSLSAKTWNFEAIGISFRTPDEIIGMTISDSQIVQHVNSETPVQVFTGVSDKYTITVTAVYLPIQSFILMPENLLISLMWNDRYSEKFRTMGITVTDVSTYRAGPLDTVRYEAIGNIGGYRAPAIMFQTVINQYCLSISMSTNYSNSSKLGHFAESIMDSLTIAGDGLTPNCFNPTITLMSGGTVTCPKGCSYEYTLLISGANIFRDGEYIMSITENDLYSSVSASERARTRRKDVNNSMFPPNDIATLLGISVSSVSTVNVGGREWYRIAGYDGSDSVVYCRIYDGYMTMFSSDKPNEQILKSMLMTVTDAWR